MDVALLPGDCSNFPGKLAFVAQGIPGKTYCLQRRRWVQGSPCEREQNWFWVALLSEQFLTLEFQLRENGVGYEAQGAACGSFAFQRPVLCLEAGMEASLLL